MSPRDVTEDPLWQADELGRPIPDSPHAVSVALPCWEHVVGYEEGDPNVVSRMQTGYPRFLVHKDVRKIAENMAPGQQCLPFPSRKAAELCAAFVSRAHAAGYPVFVYTVDAPRNVRAAAALGVDGIITNRPRATQDVLNALPARVPPRR